MIDGLDLDLHEGERVALVGSNGAGKSTLLKLLSGLDVPDAGSVTVDGTDTRTVSAAELADTVCYLCQRPEEMFLRTPSGPTSRCTRRSPRARHGRARDRGPRPRRPDRARRP
ncbi:ATP-binding cassette domain-containing protein [Oerskovia sp. M15]